MMMESLLKVKVVALLGLTLVFLTVISLTIHPSQIWESLLLLRMKTTPNTPTRESDYYASSNISLTPVTRNTTTTNTATSSYCDIFTGEWIPDPDGPYYTNNTCSAIHEYQNCMMHGRPDSEFMKWRWKPDGCELPLFNPAQFLELVKGKSMAVVGDSVGRNQMQSLICLLSRVEHPIDVSYTTNGYFQRLKYITYNFTLASFWSPHLVNSTEADPDGPTHNGLFNLYLDEFDEQWTTKIDEFDFVIISSGHWFFRSLMYYEDRKLVGCHSCLLDNVTDLTQSYGYRGVFRTAFRAINSREDYKGITFLRTFSPSHFENGLWNTGGNCLRTGPFRRDETSLNRTHSELYRAQVEEFQRAVEIGRKRGLKYRMLDITRAMLLRPDGHPSRYGHWPHERVKMANDCVHWCLPGPIDSWNDLLQEMLRREVQEDQS